jgi:ABC-type glycerol-3-phosphate transport system permease component
VRINFPKHLYNSILLAVFYTLPCILGSCFAGYGFSRFRIRESRIFFFVMMATMMIPFMVTVIPFYLLVGRYGLANKRYLWILWGLQGTPFLIFLFRQYFSTIPYSFEESARLDGAGRFQIFFRIMFPLVQTGVIIAAIYSFQWAWANYLRPAIFLSSDKANLAVKLAQGYQDPQGNIYYNVAMAGISLYSMPIVALFFVLQKWFMSGLLGGGLKG